MPDVVEFAARETAPVIDRVIAHMENRRAGRPLTDNERNAVNALIDFRASRLRRRRSDIEQSVCVFAGVRCLAELKAQDYDRAVRFLVDLVVSL